MNVGFIGLGHLGTAIAGRLVDCGHTLTVWNRTPGKSEKINGKAAASPREVAEQTDILFLCLFDSTAVHAVLNQENGILSGSVKGKIIVDLSTNHFRNVVQFHGMCEKQDAVYLETPVLGSVAPASQGALTVLVSGQETGFDQAKPVLNDIGNHIFFLREPGLATKMKLINNLTLGSFMATIAEALALGEDVGLPKSEILDILSVGGGNSLVLHAKKKKLLEDDYSTHFSNALIYKDLHCLQDLAYERKRPLFTASLTKELYARTLTEGIAQEDFSAIYKLFKNK